VKKEGDQEEVKKKFEESKAGEEPKKQTVVNSIIDSV
jgi:hypothetical protein